MSISVYSLVSEVHDTAAIDESLKNFNADIESRLNDKFCEITIEDIEKCNPSFALIYVKSGGVEGAFKKLFERVDRRFILLTSDMHNSLPAAMEILAYINARGGRGEILHGAAEFIAASLGAIIGAARLKSGLRGKRIGLIGKPSDWLIASAVDYESVKKKFGIDIVDIPIDELIGGFKKEYQITNPRAAELLNKGFDEKTVRDSLNLYECLKVLCNKYNLSAFTLRCFDLLGAIGNTGCLALSLLNDEGVTAGCEGDLPALISMIIINGLGGVKSFMANPSSIDCGRNTAIFAHCTVPLDMTGGYELDSHFESKIGVAIRGTIPSGPATIFKISNLLDGYWVSPAVILSNLNRPNLCRTQIEIKVEKGVDYFLKRPLGNHHIIARGDHSHVIDEFFGA
jgi:L-fucose isomerase-like protein